MYYEKNKEAISKYGAIYRDKNMYGYIAPIKKETSSRDKIICICGSEHRRDKTNMHNGTKKHSKFITDRNKILIQILI